MLLLQSEYFKRILTSYVNESFERAKLINKTRKRKERKQDAFNIVGYLFIYLVAIVFF